MISRGTELDLYTYQMHGGGWNAQWYPLLPGYLPCGEVVEAGPKVAHLAARDLVIGSNLLNGFDEHYCCAWGGHCEHAVVSRHSHPARAAERAVKVPENIAPSHAPLAVLGAVARKGVDTKVCPRAGETVRVVRMGVIGNFAAQVRRLLELADHPNVMANFDGGNFAKCKEDPLAGYQVLRGRVGYTHWKDVRPAGDELEYCALGDGITDWAPVVKALLADGYSGYWAMEYEEPADVEPGMRRCIEVVTAAAS